MRIELAYQPEYTTDLQRDMDKFLFRYINEAIDNKQLVGDDFEIHRHLKFVMKGVSYMWALNNGDFDVIELGLQRYEMTLAYFKTNE